MHTALRSRSSDNINEANSARRLCGFQPPFSLRWSGRRSGYCTPALWALLHIGVVSLGGIAVIPIRLLWGRRPRVYGSSGLFDDCRRRRVSVSRVGIASDRQKSESSHPSPNPNPTPHQAGPPRCQPPSPCRPPPWNPPPARAAPRSWPPLLWPPPCDCAMTGNDKLAVAKTMPRMTMRFNFFRIHDFHLKISRITERLHFLFSFHALAHSPCISPCMSPRMPPSSCPDIR